MSSCTTENGALFIFAQFGTALEILSFTASSVISVLGNSTYAQKCLRKIGIFSKQGQLLIISYSIESVLLF